MRSLINVQNPVYAICYVSIMGIFITACSEMFAPFVPAMALDKKVGIQSFMWFFAIFNIFRIAFEFILLVIIGKDLVKAKSRFEFGVLMIGLTTLIWGFMQDLNSKYAFLGIGIVLRVLSAAGSVVVAGYVVDLVGEIYPVGCYYFLGLIEIACIVAYILMMPIIGILAKYHHAHTPFFVFGGILLVLGLLTFPFIPAVPNLPDPLLTYRYFFDIHSTWTALIVSFFANVSRSYIYTALTESAFRKTKSLLSIAMMFTINKVGYLVGILFMMTVRKDMKVTAVLLQMALILKLFSFMMWAGPEIIPHTRFSRATINLCLMALLAGVTDAIMIQGAFFLLMRNAEAGKPIENLHAYKIVMRFNNICNFSGSFVGPLLAGLLVTTFGPYEAALVMAYVYGSLAFILVPFIAGSVQITKNVIRRKTIGASLLPRRSFLQCSELQKELQSLNTLDSLMLPPRSDSSRDKQQEKDSTELCIIPNERT